MGTKRSQLFIPCLSTYLVGPTRSQGFLAKPVFKCLFGTALACHGQSPGLHLWGEGEGGERQERDKDRVTM